jgi:hypothetical protein
VTVRPAGLPLPAQVAKPSLVLNDRPPEIEEASKELNEVVKVTSLLKAPAEVEEPIG